MPRLKKDTTEAPLNTTPVKTADEIKISKVYASIKKDVAELDKRTECLQNHYEDLKKNSLVIELVRMVILLVGLNFAFNMYHQALESGKFQTLRSSSESAVSDAKNESQYEIAKAVAQTGKLYYKNEKGDLTRITGRKNECLVVPAGLDGSQAITAIESCFNNY